MQSIKTNPQDIFIVVPAKNEDRYIDLLFDELEKLGLVNVVLGNDSSTDRTRELAEVHPNAIILDHVINLGAGASTQTGIAYAVSKGAEIIGTIDADLQHNPEDLVKLICHLESTGSDLVIGSRFLKINDIPKSRIFYNKIANIISFVLTGMYVTDSQSGLKVMSKKLTQSMNLNYDGFEFCMEIIKHAKVTKAKISEVPIEVTYTEATTKKGQNLRSGINILSKLLSPFS